MKVLWTFCLILLGLIVATCLGNVVENFVVVSDSSNNTTNYLTHSQFGTSTFQGTTDVCGNNTFDNYNHYNGTSSNALISGTTFYGPNGGTATVITGADGKQVIKIVVPNDPTPYDYVTINVNQWQGPNGTATLAQSSNGGMALKITLNNGQTYLYTITPGGGSGDSTSTSSYETTYIGSTGNPPPDQSNYYGYDNGANTNSYKQQYYNQPPPPPSGDPSTGIPKSMIPPGQEDLYVLKSSIIPPVCPAPVVNQCPNTTPPPPCPPCARCPEPSFDCKKVPNYSPANTNLPVPVLADFSQFGL